MSEDSGKRCKKNYYKSPLTSDREYCTENDIFYKDDDSDGDIKLVNVANSHKKILGLDGKYKYSYKNNSPKYLTKKSF